MLGVMMSEHVLNKFTVYTTVMSADGDYFKPYGIDSKSSIKHLQSVPDDLEFF